MKGLQVGDIIPDFSLKDQDENLFGIKNFRGKKKLATIFYPSCGYYGCTSEDCYFRILYESLDKEDVQIFGISLQSFGDLKEFVIINKITYPILSDPENNIRKMFIGTSSKTEHDIYRITYIADKNSKLTHVFYSLSHSKCHAGDAFKIFLLMKKKDSVNS